MWEGLTCGEEKIHLQKIYDAQLPDHVSSVPEYVPTLYIPCVNQNRSAENPYEVQS